MVVCCWGAGAVQTRVARREMAAMMVFISENLHEFTSFNQIQSNHHQIVAFKDN